MDTTTRSKSNEVASQFLLAAEACCASDQAVITFCRAFREWIRNLLPAYADSPFFIRWCKSGDQGICLYPLEGENGEGLYMWDEGLYLFLHEDEYNNWGVWDAQGECEIGDEKGWRGKDELGKAYSYSPTDLNSAYRFLRACQAGMLTNLVDFLSMCREDVDQAISKLTPLGDLGCGLSRKPPRPPGELREDPVVTEAITVYQKAQQHLKDS